VFNSIETSELSDQIRRNDQPPYCQGLNDRLSWEQLLQFVRSLGRNIFINLEVNATPSSLAINEVIVVAEEAVSGPRSLRVINP
jgi:hypothetical protein